MTSNELLYKVQNLESVEHAPRKILKTDAQRLNLRALFSGVSI